MKHASLCIAAIVALHLATPVAARAIGVIADSVRVEFDPTPTATCTETSSHTLGYKLSFTVQWSSWGAEGITRTFKILLYEDDPGDDDNMGAEHEFSVTMNKPVGG